MTAPPPLVPSRWEEVLYDYNTDLHGIGNRSLLQYYVTSICDFTSISRIQRSLRPASIFSMMMMNKHVIARPEYSVITNQTLHNFFVNSSNISATNFRDIKFFLGDYYFFGAPCSDVVINNRAPSLKSPVIKKAIIGIIFSYWRLSFLSCRMKDVTVPSLQLRIPRFARLLPLDHY